MRKHSKLFVIIYLNICKLKEYGTKRAAYRLFQIKQILLKLRKNQTLQLKDNTIRIVQPLRLVFSPVVKFAKRI